jgi:hypothetical protein
MSFSFNYGISPNGKRAVISMRPPEIASSDGSFTFVMKGRHLAEMRDELSRHKLSPEDSPFTAGSKVTVMAREMRSVIGKANLDNEIQWLIEVLLPRLLIDENSYRPLQESFMLSSFGPFLLNSGFSVRNTDPIMSAESLLTQPRSTFDFAPGASFLSFFTETEMATLAAAVLRASFRDAIVTEIVQPNGEIKRSVGVFVGSEELVNFCFSPYHLDFNILALYSDVTVKSMLVLESAENMYKRLFMTDAGQGFSIDECINAVKTRAELAVRYWEDNPVVPKLIKALEEHRATHTESTKHIPFQEICQRIFDSAESLVLDVASKGIGSRGGIFSRAKPGLFPDHIEYQAKQIIDSAAKIIQTHGITMQTIGITETIRELCAELGRLGLPKERLENITLYALSKLES